MILIVDDKQENLFSLKSLLELHHFKVDTAKSGEEALKKILKQEYALIIMDVQMPGMDGFEVVETLSGFSKAKDVPILFLSAVNTDKRFITKGYRSGVIDYITKPFDPDILLLKVKTFCRLSEQNRELNEIHKALREEIEYRKRVEAELFQNMLELRSILESIPNIAFTASTDGRIEFVNTHWYSYSESKDQFPEIVSGSLTDHLNQAIQSGNQMLTEVRLISKTNPDGRFHILSLTPILKGNTIVKWVGVFTDIHEQRMSNYDLERHVAERTRELQESYKELEARNLDLQQFASVASHDLQEPLRKIHVFGNMLRERYLSNIPEALPLMNRIISASSRMTMLINDLLTHSGLSVASGFQKVNLQELLSEITSDLELTIQEKDALIYIGAMPVVQGIPGQLRQVFQNILTNALKFSRKDIRPEISVTSERIAELSADSPADETGSFCRIQIADNGIGFNEVYLDKIFTIFQRLNSREEYEGTGIGLAIVKKIIDKHGGIITAKSKENEGSTFIIVLPVEQ